MFFSMQKSAVVRFEAIAQVLKKAMSPATFVQGSVYPSTTSQLLVYSSIIPFYLSSLANARRHALINIHEFSLFMHVFVHRLQEFVSIIGDVSIDIPHAPDYTGQVLGTLVAKDLLSLRDVIKLVKSTEDPKHNATLIGGMYIQLID
jgi:uncharacterized membrane protein